MKTLFLTLATLLLMSAAGIADNKPKPKNKHYAKVNKNKKKKFRNMFGY